MLNERSELRQALASGAMGDVFLADHLRLGRQVAVKLLSPEEAEDARSLERFRREAQAAAAVHHPNVVAVYDWGTTDHTAFLVMQYVPGADLRQLLHDNSWLPEAQALRLASEIAAALQPRISTASCIATLSRAT